MQEGKNEWEKEKRDVPVKVELIKKLQAGRLR